MAAYLAKTHRHLPPPSQLHSPLSRLHPLVTPAFSTARLR